MRKRKKHEKRWLKQERNYVTYVRRGMDYYVAGLCSVPRSISGIQSGLVVQRLKHVTKSLRWSKEYLFKGGFTWVRTDDVVILERSYHKYSIKWPQAANSIL